MRLTSHHWDEILGVCTLHSLPALPCPACTAGDGHEDLELVITEVDRLYMDFDPDHIRCSLPNNLVPRFERRDLRSA